MTLEFTYDRTHIGSVPPHVEEAALQLLRKSWEDMRRDVAPSDGGLRLLGSVDVGDGAYNPGGYSIQVQYVCDERFEDMKKPTLRAYVFGQVHNKADGFLSAVGPETDADVLATLQREHVLRMGEQVRNFLRESAADLSPDMIREIYERLTPLANRTLGKWCEPHGSCHGPYRARRNTYGTETASVTISGGGYLVYIRRELQERWLAVDASKVSFDEVLKQVDEELEKLGFGLCMEQP